MRTSGRQLTNIFPPPPSRPSLDLRSVWGFNKGVRLWGGGVSPPPPAAFGCAAGGWILLLLLDKKAPRPAQAQERGPALPRSRRHCRYWRDGGGDKAPGHFDILNLLSLFILLSLPVFHFQPSRIQIQIRVPILRSHPTAPSPHRTLPCRRPFLSLSGMSHRHKWCRFPFTSHVCHRWTTSPSLMPDGLPPPPPGGGTEGRSGRLPSF